MAESMASKDKAHIPFDKLSDEFLMCPLCFEQFTAPKVLPCQHSFCLICLRNYVSVRGFEHTIPCPLCKERVIIPGNDVANFKNNFMLVSLSSFVENTRNSQVNKVAEMQCTSTGDTHNSGDQTCGACSEPGTLSSFCQSCTLWLCAICTKAHGRLPATSAHPLLSNEEVDRQCKAVVERGLKSLTDFQQANTERQDFLLSQSNQLPEHIGTVKRKIESALEEACRVIREKANNLQEQADNFQQEQQEDLACKLSVVSERREEINRLTELLKAVEQSTDGFQNQKAVKTVERYLLKHSFTDFTSQDDNIRSLAFSAFSTNLKELKNLEMGELRMVTGKASNFLCLHDRPLGIHKIASLVDRDYITALAINKFADKFVVANNQSVLVFKPDSRIPKPFLSSASERSVNKPWGIAYCEDDRKIYISESGRHEGDGAVVAFSLDGTFHSVIASGLTLPRGITVYKGYIFVCDQIDRCVYIFNMAGKVIRVLKKTPDGKYIFNGPMFISVGRNGTIAVSDNCSSVKVFDKDCVLKFTYTSSLPESQFWDVMVMQNGIVVCDWKRGLHKISPDFGSNGLICMETNTLREPSALAALENGNCVYVGTCGGEIFSAI